MCGILDGADSGQELEVDRGIGVERARRAVVAGAGEAVFGAPESVAAGLTALRDLP